MPRTRLLRNTSVALAVVALVAAGVCVFATATAGDGSPVFPSLVPVGVDIVETKAQYETHLLAQQVGRGAAAFTVVAALAAVVPFALFLRARRRAETLLIESDAASTARSPRWGHDRPRRGDPLRRPRDRRSGEGPADEVRHADRWWRWGSHLAAMLVLAAACAASWGLLITSASAEESLRGGAAEPWMPLALWFVAGPLFAAVMAGLGRARRGSTGSWVCARWGLLAVVSTAGLFASTVGVFVVVVQPWGAFWSDAVLFLDVALLVIGVVSHVVGAFVGLRARAR